MKKSVHPLPLQVNNGPIYVFRLMTMAKAIGLARVTVLNDVTVFQ